MIIADPPYLSFFFLNNRTSFLNQRTHLPIILIIDYDSEINN